MGYVLQSSSHGVERYNYCKPEGDPTERDHLSEWWANAVVHESVSHGGLVRARVRSDPPFTFYNPTDFRNLRFNKPKRTVCILTTERGSDPSVTGRLADNIGEVFEAGPSTSEVGRVPVSREAAFIAFTFSCKADMCSAASMKSSPSSADSPPGTSFLRTVNQLVRLLLLVRRDPWCNKKPRRGCGSLGSIRPPDPWERAPPAGDENHHTWRPLFERVGQCCVSIYNPAWSPSNSHDHPSHISHLFFPGVQPGLFPLLLRLQLKHTHAMEAKQGGHSCVSDVLFPLVSLPADSITCKKVDQIFMLEWGLKLFPYVPNPSQPGRFRVNRN
ncbi:hypothetical protein HPP92_001723 [Vanilla planifolia]|uniref:Uncharacterized protein n=1 Tax=Vanilla planifolia TaxID=51239 RepID=A0A835S0E3_VANPL|nr:hypothetical protein HPP92_001723 [Vanilla planifolia]